MLRVTPLHLALAWTSFGLCAVAGLVAHVLLALG